MSEYSVWKVSDGGFVTFTEDPVFAEWVSSTDGRSRSSPTRSIAMGSETRNPAPREHYLLIGDLAGLSHWIYGVYDATVVAAVNRALYRLVMVILEEIPVPGCMPAQLATDNGGSR